LFPPSLSLRQRLLLLAVAVALPLLLCGSAALYLFAEQKRASLEASLVDTARALSAAVDSELLGVVTAAQAMSQSAAFDEKRFDRLYELARRVRDDHPAWHTVTLTTAAGEPIFNLRRPFGDRLPRSAAEETMDELRSTGTPVIGDLFVGNVSGVPLFPVRVPVTRDAELRYILSIGVRPEALLAIIQRQRVPQDGVVAFIDGAGRIVARSRNHEQFLGQPITPDLRKALDTSGEGFATLYTLEGRATHAAYSRSARTGWSVALGVPPQVIGQPLAQALLLAGLGLALSVFLGVLAAITVARGITRPIEGLGRAAEAVGRGDPPAFPSQGIPEVQKAVGALADALEKRRSAENEKDLWLRSEREARRAAEEASRQKDQFLAMLGHELRNPLAAISNGVHLLLRDPPSDTARHTREMLGRQVEHLSHVIDDLLQVGRVITGKIELERGPVELRALLEAVLAALRAGGRLKEREVSVNAQPVWVSGDGHRLEQVVSNLLVNAVKYTRAGGRIDVRVFREDGEALLRFEDDGIGMTPEVIGRVFELFYQGHDTMARSEGGLGVGLTLVRRLVELHGGTVSAESGGTGRGAVFTVRLPALAGVASLPRQQSPRPPPRSILVVEDNADARASFAALLKADGHRIHEAADGTAGVAAALREGPAAAFIDLGLPDIDGYECARRIRAALGRRILLVALSGYGLEEHRRRALEAGFDAHLTKPAAPDAVWAILADPHRRDAVS
jgi:signal transduction histidine kinase/CheY-like chemotaxis protein